MLHSQGICFWNSCWSLWLFPNYSRCLPSWSSSIRLLSYFCWWARPRRWIWAGIGNDRPILYLIVKVLSAELPMSWRLNPTPMAQQYTSRRMTTVPAAKCVCVCDTIVWIRLNTSINSVCAPFSMHYSASKPVPQCVLWQDVIHHLHTDCRSNYNIRGYPLIWKPSNHGLVEQMAPSTNLTLMDLSWSKLEENLMSGGVDSDVICFFWLYFGKSVTQALTAADRHGHTGNVCSLWRGRTVERTPGIPDNITTDVQEGITAQPIMMALGLQHKYSPLVMLLDIYGPV